MANIDYNSQANLHPVISVLVADNNIAAREFLRQQMQGAHDLEVVADARNVDETVRLTIQLDPDVVILDLSTPNFNGLEAVKTLRLHGSTTKIMLISRNETAGIIQNAILAGANGYFLKDTDPRELACAIRAIAAGAMCFSTRVMASLLPGDAAASHLNHKKADQPCPYGLSNREREVLAKIAQGMPNKAIAKALAISVRTVESHRMNIREKTGGGNTAQLTRIADKLNLTSPSGPPMN